MRVFRFWWELPLDLPFHGVAYTVIPTREIREDTPYFEEIVKAVKEKTPCKWTMTEFTQASFDTNASENEVYNHRKVAA